MLAKKDLPAVGIAMEWSVPQAEYPASPCEPALPGRGIDLESLSDWALTKSIIVTHEEASASLSLAVGVNCLIISN